MSDLKPKSKWPLLDELWPPVEYKPYVPPPAQPSVTPQQSTPGEEIQKILFKLFGTVPRNRLKEAGLD